MWLLTLLYILGAATASYLGFKFLRFIHLYFIRASSLPRYHHGDSPWALVTGASDGIGQGFAQELARRRFNVVLHGRNPTKLEKVKSQLSRGFPKIQFRITIADASHPDVEAQVKNVVSSVQDLHLTMLVNNVGGSEAVLGSDAFRTLEKHSSSEIENLIRVNDVFATELTTALLPTLTRNQPSLVMNIGSMAAFGCFPFLSVYSGTKAYIMAWSGCLHMEMKAEGKDIEVLGLYVGRVQSNQMRRETDFMTPSSKVMAMAALDRVGCNRLAVVGYFAHALGAAFLDILPSEILIPFMIDRTRAEKVDWDKRR